MADLVDVSVSKIVTLEPARPVRGWPTLDPMGAEYANPHCEPIYGHHPIRALVNGGPWNLGEEPEPLRTDSGAPRLPKSHLEADGSTGWCEPDPKISGQRWTMQLARAMFRAGWTLDQAWSTFWHYRETGGSYWTYRCDRERKPVDDPGHYAVQLWAALIETERKRMPVGVVGQQLQKDPKISEKKIDRLLHWISRHPDANQRTLTDALIVPRRWTRTYLVDMESRGMVHPVWMIGPDRSGHQQKMKFWRLTPGNPRADEFAAAVEESRIDVDRLARGVNGRDVGVA